MFGKSNVKPVQRLMRDPTCGMTINPEYAYQTTLGVKTYYFCGSRCKSEFKKSMRRKESQQRNHVPMIPKAGRAKSCH